MVNSESALNPLKTKFHNHLVTKSSAILNEHNFLENLERDFRFCAFLTVEVIQASFLSTNQNSAIF